MVKKIVNGRIVDDGDGAAPGARPQAVQDVFGVAGLNFDVLKKQFFVPYVNTNVPGWALLAVVVVVAFSWGLLPGLMLGAAVVGCVCVCCVLSRTGSPPML